MSKPITPEQRRNCCDGQCTQGRRCAAFAPTVIDGPHRRRPGWMRAAGRTAARWSWLVFDLAAMVAAGTAVYLLVRIAINLQSGSPL